MSKRLLIVDDEKMVNDYFAEIARDIGINPTQALTCEEGFEIYKTKYLNKEPFDGLLTDYDTKSRMNGIELLIAITDFEEQNGVLVPVPKIITSSYEDKCIEAMQHGIYMYLVKPFNSEKVEKALRYALSMPKES